MLKVICGNNLNRKTVMMPEDTVLRAALADAGVDSTKGITSLNGRVLFDADLDKTFADFGASGTVSLLNVVKADNA